MPRIIPYQAGSSKGALLRALDEYQRHNAQLRLVVKELQSKNRSLLTRLQWTETRADKERAAQPGRAA
jgi:hypothetical protein